MIVADSDVLIDALRGHEPGLGRITLELGTGRLATTSISVFELRSGAKSKRERAKVEALLAALTVLPLDTAAATAAATVRVELEAEGRKLAMAD